MKPDTFDLMHVGARLAQARRREGMSISDVADRTKVASRFLMAIEDEALGQLPSRIHAIGFARSFAQCVRLDAEEIGGAMRDRLDFEAAQPRPEPCESRPPDQFSRIFRSVKSRFFA